MKYAYATSLLIFAAATTTCLTAEAGTTGRFLPNFSFEFAPGTSRVPLAVSPDAYVCFLTGLHGKFGENTAARIAVRNGEWVVYSDRDPGPIGGTVACVEVQSSADYSGEFYWEQSMPATTLSSDPAVCFLTGIGGHFQGGGESVYVQYQSYGQWVLNGNSMQRGVKAWARCVHGSGGWKLGGLGPFVTNASYRFDSYGSTWYGNRSTPQPLPACFLSAVSGTLQDPSVTGNSISLTVRDQTPPNYWWADISSAGNWIWGQMTCMW